MCVYNICIAIITEKGAMTLKESEEGLDKEIERGNDVIYYNRKK